MSVNSKKKEIYYIDFGNIYSQNYKKYDVIKNISKFDVCEKPISESEELFLLNKLYLEKLDENLRNKEKIKIFGFIESFDEFKKKFEDMRKKKKIKFENVKDDDFKFLEMISQKDILRQLIKNIVEDSNLRQIEIQVKNYIKLNLKNEKEFFEEVENEKGNIKDELKKLSDEKKEILKEIEGFEKKLSKGESIEKKLYLDIEKLEKEIEDNKELDNLGEIVKDLNLKLEYFKFKIEEDKIEIKIQKAKINSINTKLSLGKRKQLNFWSFVLTLGLIYWTKFSDLKYQKMKIYEKIAKIEEKELIYEKKIHKIKNEIKLKSKKLERIQKRKVKNEAEILEKKEEIENKISELKTEKAKFVKKIELFREKDLKKIEEKINQVEEKIEKINEKLKFYKKYSLDKVNEKLKQIAQFKDENLSKLKRDLKQLEGQKINVKKQVICRI